MHSAFRAMPRASIVFRLTGSPEKPRQERVVRISKKDLHYLMCQDEQCETAACTDRRNYQDKIEKLQQEIDELKKPPEEIKPRRKK